MIKSAIRKFFQWLIGRFKKRPVELIEVPVYRSKRREINREPITGSRKKIKARRRILNKIARHSRKLNRPL